MDTRFVDIDFSTWKGASMKDGKTTSVWFKRHERIQLEEAAARAGYLSLSKFIRDKTLTPTNSLAAANDGVEAWAEQQELLMQLESIQKDQYLTQVLLSMLLFLVRKRATTGELVELIVALSNAPVATDILASSKPDLAALIARHLEDAQ